jgi:hypothetical protein
VVDRSNVVNKLLPIPTAVIESFFLGLPGMTKRLSEAFYEEVESKQAVLCREPSSFEACADWCALLRNVQNQAEDIQARFSQIVGFYEYGGFVITI